MDILSSLSAVKRDIIFPEQYFINVYPEEDKY